MKKMIMIATIFFCSVSASATSYIETAKSFIDALNQERAADIADLLADDIVFEDPTWGAHETGKANVLKVYAGLMTGAWDVNTLVLDAFESSGVVVLTYVIGASMDLVENATPDQRAQFMGKMVRVIRFKDGKIIQHTDMMDAEKLIREMQAAADARGININ